MHLHVIIAFALLLWWPEGERPVPPLPGLGSPFAAVLVVVGQLLVLAWLARRLSAATRARLAVHQPAHVADTPHRAHTLQDAQHCHQRHVFLLRVAVLATFIVDLLLTGWANWIDAAVGSVPVPALAEVVTLSPFLLGAVVVLLTSFDADLAIREAAARDPHTTVAERAQEWTPGAYLDFHVRHQLLVVLAPLTIILAIFDLIEWNERHLAALLPVPWLTEMLRGVAAACVFVAAPWMLKHVWTTKPLPAGVLRGRLQSMCERIGLRCRDILVWHSGGMMVNAAVMGVLPRVRYVMLSDGLLESMSDRQIEAVFGHEAGHVRHWHIPCFILFAVATMLISSGLMELAYQWSARNGDALAVEQLQSIGLVVLVAMWALGFGPVSRRFERQADLFGARCVTPETPADCHLPCGVHADATGGAGDDDHERLCATGAAVFSSALDRVATLNGVPHDEDSWRHSSIASRMAHLSALSADPRLVRRFGRSVTAIKWSLMIICVVGTAFSIWYVWPYVLGEWRNAQ